MSNLDPRPTETQCRSAAARGAVVEFFPARNVPLGGIRATKVDRVLPQRALPTVGAWCFLDQWGPQRDDMGVLPHPHTGLQTVTWPFAGQIHHRDSLGSDVVIHPGQLNLMTSGRGISHSEFSLGDRPLLHGLQLWVALPADAATVEPGFEQHGELPRHETGGLAATVFLGALGDAASPATTYTPLVGAQLDVAAGTAVTIPLRGDFEHAVLVIDGALEVAGTPVGPGPLLYLGIGRERLAVSASERSRAVLIGGEPFPDELVVWWNFVGRSHEEIVAARADWEGADPKRFGTITGHGDERIPAPTLPAVRLKPRRRR